MKKLSLIALFSLLLITLSYLVWAETITLTSYYPAPYGAYKELRSQRMAIGDTYYDGSQYCWEGTCTTTIGPNIDLIVEGALKVGGSETGTAASDIKAYIKKVACENRRGVWVDEEGCDEYAYYTLGCVYDACACTSGYHMCTFVDLFSGGFASLRRPGYNCPKTYAWVIGRVSHPDRFFYPWGYGDALQCNAGSHYMMDMRRGASGQTAWGCYKDTYTGAAAMCCKDSQ